MSLAVASPNEVLQTKDRRRRTVCSYVENTSGWHVFLFFVLSANACAIDSGEGKHCVLNKNHDPKGEAATQPSEGSRRANWQRRWMWLFVRPWFQFLITNIKPQTESRWWVEARQWKAWQTAKHPKGIALIAITAENYLSMAMNAMVWRVFLYCLAETNTALPARGLREGFSCFRTKWRSS